MTVVKLVYILGNFCKYRTCSSQVLNFLPTETIILSCFCVCVCVCVCVFFFWGGGGGFKFVGPVMTCKMMLQICKEMVETGSKTDFVVHFEFFLCKFSYTLRVMPQDFAN